ncbi:hypothetical protein BS17DRAFT_767397 [Gyrodon lividus]|nr:hypothetical protein BS17DRAFT_767397 [Gyrodon lividus]
MSAGMIAAAAIVLLSGNDWAHSVFKFYNDTLFPASSSCATVKTQANNNDPVAVNFKEELERTFELGHTAPIVQAPLQNVPPPSALPVPPPTPPMPPMLPDSGPAVHADPQSNPEATTEPAMHDIAPDITRARPKLKVIRCKGKMAVTEDVGMKGEEQDFSVASIRRSGRRVKN